jgi:hypothetical protein
MTNSDFKYYKKKYILDLNVVISVDQLDYYA